MILVKLFCQLFVIAHFNQFPERLPGGFGDELGQLVAQFGIEVDTLEVSYDDGDGGVFRDALPFGISQVFRNGDLGCNLSVWTARPA